MTRLTKGVQKRTIQKDVTQESNAAPTNSTTCTILYDVGVQKRALEAPFSPTGGTGLVSMRRV